MRAAWLVVLLAFCSTGPAAETLPGPVGEVLPFADDEVLPEPRPDPAPEPPQPAPAPEPAPEPASPCLYYHNGVLYQSKPPWWDSMRGSPRPTSLPAASAMAYGLPSTYPMPLQAGPPAGYFSGHAQPAFGGMMGGGMTGGGMMSGGMMSGGMMNCGPTG